MVYFGTVASEKIVYHVAGEPNNRHYVELKKSLDEPVLYVRHCCNKEWRYKLNLQSNSDYDRIKFNIMNAVFECEESEELFENLSEIFEDGFSGIRVCVDD